ncbi:hypothetical protein V1478_003658 [Vespula squamosa]|uniref:Uncharacterized protein n=1 Tax=Vespula squamosa TaxID=30214 RepID=A0ABD2BMX6_VESSQ
MMDHSISLLRRSALAFVTICIFSIRFKFLQLSSPPSLNFKLKSNHCIFLLKLKSSLCVLKF